MDSAVDIVFEKFYFLKRNTSDINEHFDTLAKYSSECESVLELGVRSCISSWAFLMGLIRNESENKILFLNDIEECNVQEIVDLSSNVGIQIQYKWCNDLDLEFTHTFDLVFIDTWHVYAQLKRELEKFGKIAKKYILLHDTTVDEFEGESIRCGSNIHEQSLQSGFPEEEIRKGLWPAVTEFLEANPDWILEKRYTNNNGLTILKRVN